MRSLNDNITGLRNYIEEKYVQKVVHGLEILALENSIKEVKSDVDKHGDWFKWIVRSFGAVAITGIGTALVTLMVHQGVIK
jgi:hypothetical protein